MPRVDGTPTIAELAESSDPVEYTRRGEGLWPPEDDCPRCPGHRDGEAGHPEGAHKLSCRPGWRIPVDVRR